MRGRILFGLDALPRGVALDDPRLPAVVLGPAPLRLNTHPVPQVVLAGAGSGHAARVAAVTAWLLALAGDWAAGRRRLVGAYLAFAAAEIERGRGAIETGLARYDGVFAAEDYLWSALRPLPRAWIAIDGAAPRFAEMAFWDGRAVHEVGLRGPEADGVWPDALRGFWREDDLPRSPFRRPGAL